MSKRILVILSSHPELAGEPNGTYLPELVHGVAAFEEAGLAYDLASVKGGAIPYYGADADAQTKAKAGDEAFSARLQKTTPLADVDPDRYDAVFYPGGYGLLFDLVDNADSGRLAAAVHARGGVVGAVCHGPAALSGVELADGERLVAGRDVTGFTHEEEVAMQTREKVPFLVGTRLVEAGATYRKRKAWDEFVVADGRLITGQNPQSAHGVGLAMLEAMKG